MMNNGKKRKKVPPSVPPRKRRMVCLMSEEEVQIVDRYLETYQIKNKARWLRETILAFIHQNMEDDYPTLFIRYLLVQHIVTVFLALSIAFP